MRIFPILLLKTAHLVMNMC